MAELAPVLKQKFTDAIGVPLSGGKVYSYIANTSTPLATYTDQGGLTPNANPVILDSNGEAGIWLAPGTYKFVLTDSSDVVKWTVDNVQTTDAQIAAAVNVAGALSILNNLSDLNSVPTALTNLGIAPFSVWTKYSVTDGQAATSLTGQTVSSATYTSAIYEFEIIRGTTVFSSGRFVFQYKNSAWQIVQGLIDGDDHGVTWSFTGTTTAQLKAALDVGAGNGTIKLSRRLVAI